MEDKYDSDDDSDYGEIPPRQQAESEAYYKDPQRQSRIQSMMEANDSSAFSILEDDQVTDFVLRMAQKNQDKADGIAPAPHDPNNYTIGDDFSSDDSEDDEGAPHDDLDASFTSDSRRKKLQQDMRKRSPDDYPPGEAYQGDEEQGGVDIPSFDPKDDDMLTYGRLCCVACALVIGMIAVSIIILVFVLILDGDESSQKSREYEGMVLPVAPGNLRDLCAANNLNSMQGVLDCRDPCMKAACCWEMSEAGGDPVCWESHALECAPYESCVNLLHAGSDPRPDRPTSTIPHAPDGLSSCDPAKIGSVDQILLCEDACMKGEVCKYQEKRKRHGLVARLNEIKADFCC